MSNLKKILALVLALVMSMSLVTVASADYADENQIDARYAVAVEVLSDMGIFQGYNGGESFGPKQSITREEVATMMYRVISTDTTGKAGLYVEACDFADVNNGRWSEGYIGYCFNGNYVKGYEDGTFRPTADVTGYEVLAMILRAVGYDANGEFSGSNWKKNIGTTAQQLGILDNLASNVVLSKPATREVVAELIFQTLAYVDMVEYTPAFSYQPIMGTSTIGLNQITLGEKNFGLYPGSRTEIDDWGRPGYYWFYNTGKTCIEEAYVSRYTTAVTECQLYQDLKGTYTGDVTVKYFVDGIVDGNGDAKDYKYKLQSTDYTHTLGGQGVELELYKDRIVMINTWLAEVKNVTDVVKDPAGHVVTKATITLWVYDNGYNVAPTVITYDAFSNFSYKIGDLLLVSSKNADNHIANVNGLAGDEVIHDEVNYITYRGYASSVIGGQTYIWANADKHTVEGQTYDDAETFYRDEAGVNTGDYKWLFDNHGNLIGAVELPEVDVYGIIENIQWINPIGAAGYAQATIRYIDGTTAVKTIYAVDQNMNGDLTDAGDVLTYKGVNQTVDATNGIVSDNWAENAAWCAKDLFKIVETAKGAVLTHVMDGVNKAEITTADVKTGNYTITDGTNIKAYVNGDTVFMVKLNNAWTLVTGYQNIGNYSVSDLVTVDYLNTDIDPYLEFVFLTGPADSSSAKGLFYKTSNNYGYDPTTGVFTYQGIVDGAAGTLKTTYNLTGLANYALVELTYKNGNVVDYRAFDVAGDNLDTTYTGLSVSKFKASAAQYASNTTWNGVVLAGNTYTSTANAAQYYNVVDLAPAFGTWENNMGDHEIWVVWKSVNGANVAVQVYIAPSSTLNTDNASGGVVNPTNTVTFEIDGFTYVNNAFVMNLTASKAVTGVAYITITDANGTVVAYANNVALAAGSATQTITQPATVVSGAQYTMTVAYALTGETAAATVDTIIVH